MMATLTVPSGLSSILDGITRPYFLGLQQRVANRARAGAPRRTGELASSIRTEVIPLPGRSIYSITADSPYATATELGTQPHIIRPRGKAMHFIWEEQGGLETIVPTKRTRHRVTRGGILIIGKAYVNHPGTTGTKFLSRALEEELRI